MDVVGLPTINHLRILKHMSSFQVNNEELGFNGKESLLVIKPPTGDAVVVSELALNDFEVFYKKWSLAMQLGGKDDFLNSWTFNQPFRSLITECLQTAGVMQPELLRLSQLEALLLSYEGKEGLLFQLHNTFPKLLAQEPLSKTWVMNLATALSLITLMLQESLHTLSWTEKPLVQLGLFHVSCVSWLSRRGLLSSEMKIGLKPHLEKDGKTTLRIPN